MRRTLAGLALTGLAVALPTLAGLTGCGTSYPLPTEHRADRTVPTAQSYKMVATWTGQTGVNDVLISPGGQLYVLFNTGGTDETPRGRLAIYKRTSPDEINPPAQFPNMFNPAAVTIGNNSVFVLDQGDTCLARQDPGGGCSGGRISRLDLYWRVREYHLLGSDTLSTFTDTTMAWVNGIGADNLGRVYVSGVQIVIAIDPSDSRLHERQFLFRINRYARGPRYPGVVPNDRNMPGAAWHRDTTWTVEEGSGVGSVIDPHRMAVGPATDPTLFVADTGKNWAQKIAFGPPAIGIYEVDNADGTALNNPTSVAVDPSGNLYVVDTGNARVLRFTPDGVFQQLVDLEPDAQGQTLQLPLAVAVDDSNAYVADRTLAKIIRYVRRSL